MNHQLQQHPTLTHAERVGLGEHYAHLALSAYEHTKIANQALDSGLAAVAEARPSTYLSSLLLYLPPAPGVVHAYAPQPQRDLSSGEVIGWDTLLTATSEPLPPRSGLLHLVIDGGTQRALGGFAEQPWRQPVLFARGARFRITDIETRDGITTVHLTELVEVHDRAADGRREQASPEPEQAEQSRDNLPREGWRALDAAQRRLRHDFSELEIDTASGRVTSRPVAGKGKGRAIWGDLSLAPDPNGLPRATPTRHEHRR
jgi:hypothetical protein